MISFPRDLIFSIFYTIRTILAAMIWCQYYNYHPLDCPQSHYKNWFEWASRSTSVSIQQSKMHSIMIHFSPKKNGTRSPDWSLLFLHSTVRHFSTLAPIFFIGSIKALKKYHVLWRNQIVRPRCLASWMNWCILKTVTHLYWRQLLPHRFLSSTTILSSRVLADAL